MSLPAPPESRPSFVDVDGHAVVAVAERDGDGRHEPGGAAGLVRGDLDAGGCGRGDGRGAVDEGDGAGGAGADLEVVGLACSGGVADVVDAVDGVGRERGGLRGGRRGGDGGEADADRERETGAMQSPSP